MNEETFNMELRRFLKRVGITSQRKMEEAVREALDQGRLKGSETVPARVTLEIDSLGVREVIEGNIALE
ncbi:MAG: DUF6494 family protein [Gammaproteobacteria bacterium]|nr:DUF6494 family protein [Gammaproteobacteria bacterium]MDD9824154.1 DUF6494 family protein [Gammaproteobacteria bacterium]MDD9863021.1 DUF6494 family protein [Gammaproteobacteria bacterium]